MTNDASAMVNLEAVRTAITTMVDGEWPSEDEDVADFTGLIRAEEVRLADFRRLLLSETAPAEGKAYRVVESRSATRSYNTARILSDFMEDGSDMLTTMFELMRTGALKLEWKWTKLKGEFEKRDVSMVVASHEIDEDSADLESPHVGEVWSTSTSVVAK